MASERMGGTAILIQNQFQLGRLAATANNQSNHFRTGDGSTVVPVQFHQITILMFAIYMETSIGMVGPNLQRLASTAATLTALGLQYIGMGDFNATPEQLAATGIQHQTQGCIISPVDAAATCTQGQGRVIDYMLVSRRVMSLLSPLTLDMDTDWKPHVGLQVCVTCDASKLKEPGLVKPPPYQL